jgi:hypothetical protein
MNTLKPLFVLLAFSSASAFAAQPTAGNLAGMTPDAITLLAAVLAVSVVVLGISMAIKGFEIVAGLVSDEIAWRREKREIDDDDTWYANQRDLELERDRASRSTD